MSEEIESGLYGFVQPWFEDGKHFIILTIGKAKNKKKRIVGYRTTNAAIEFTYWQDVPVNYLTKREGQLKSQLAKIYPTWKNSVEQFVIEESDEPIDLEKYRTCLSEDINLPISKLSPQKMTDYFRATLDGEVVDSRDFRPNCDIIPGEIAQLKDKDLREPFRTRKTYATLEGNKIIMHDKEQTIYLSANAHNMDRVCKADQKHREKLNIPQDNGFIS